jgi:N-acetylglucosamine kinase-like BadF-type ATPase
VQYIKLQVIIMIRVALTAHRYVVGVDGGATKTIALIGNDTGAILGRGQSGSSNYHNVGTTAASIAIGRAVIDARKRARLRRNEPEVAVVALAAINSPRDRAIALRFVRATQIARTSIVVHDSMAALQAATQNKPGIIVISGTGCVAAGINKAGKYLRVGGWGYLIDDEGSAYDIGRKALMSAFRMLDGRSPKTKLLAIFKRKFQVKTLEDASSMIYSNRMSVEEIAALTPLVSDAASSDRVCREILSGAGTSLAQLACVVARRLNMTRERFTIALIGGTFRSGRYLLQPFRAEIRKECPRAKVEIMKVEPVLGAFSLAVSELQKRHSWWQ